MLKTTILLFILPFILSAQSVVINEVMSSNQSTITDQDGDTPDWLELFNSASDTIDLSGYALSDDSTDLQKWVFGNVSINPGAYLLVFASDKDRQNVELHSNFKISAEGEEILLTDTSATVIDRIWVPELPADLSFARDSDGQTPWTIQSPSPMASNNGSGFQGYADSVAVSLTGHFYSSPISIELSAAESKIYYTLDGSDPDSNAIPYINAIDIENTAVLKAISYKENHLPGPLLNHSYFINENSSLPVISISTDPVNLWSDSAGIFADGPGWTPDAPHHGANFWMDWERPAHITFFDDDKNMGFSENCGIAVYGGYTRSFAQKSVSIKFKDEYNASAIEYPLFPGFDVTTFKSFILRNSGNDFDYTHIRDAFMQTLVKDLDIDYLEYRPAVTFINGEYWGIYNIREKISEHYLSNRYGVDPDNIDMVEGYLGYTDEGDLDGNLQVIHGDSLHFLEIINYMQNNDMSTEQAYTFIDSMIDLDECLLYFATQVYINSQDWPANNTKLWRERSANGKWRWVLYDLDFGFNLYEEDGQSENHVYYIFSGDPTRPWSNPVWATYIPRKLVENPTIRNRYINLVADLLNTKFQPARVKNIMNEMAGHIANEIGRHREKWSINGSFADYHLNTRMTSFAEQRPAYLRGFIRDFFDVGANAVLNISATGAGDVVLNTLSLTQDDLPWSGTYFSENEVHLNAVPAPGYVFSGWSGTVTSQNVTLDLSGMETINLVANFSADTSLIHNVVINEINYNSSDLFDTGDWVEFYNRSSKSVSLDNWVFKDSSETHSFLFPSGTELAAGAFLVLVEDDSAFSNHFPEIENFIGKMGFGLSGNGELIRLFDETGQLIDSVVYDDSDPWPTQADGFGATLELIDASFDNALAENWQASDDYGSPGQDNFGEVTLVKEQDNKIPAKFLLFQNYPNPFNSTTKIRFQLDKSYSVEIRVFDINGKVVESVPNTNYDGGTYSLALKFSEELASGLYFYQLLLNNRVAGTGKMILIR